MDEKQLSFLRMIASNGRDIPSRAWAQQIREALSDGLVRVGFGGVCELTEAGREALAANSK